MPKSFQRPVKRRVERTYQLDLALAGISVEDVSLHFHQARSRDPLTEARARQVEWRVVREKVAAGLLDPDSAAREMGYDDWYDVARVPFSDKASLQLADSKSSSRPLEKRQHRFRFESFAQRYRHVRPRLTDLTATPMTKAASPTSNGNTEPLQGAAIEGCLTN